MLSFIENVINQVGYVGIVILMFIENIFPPLPSEIIMPFAGFATRQGDLSIQGVILAGTLGSELGAIALYGISYRVGEERVKAWVEQHGHWIGVSADDIDKGDRWLQKYGLFAMFIGRLIPGVRSAVCVPAGIARINPIGFIIATTLGSAIWTGLLTYAGYALGENYEQISTYLDPISYVVLGGLLLFFIYRVWQAREKRKSSSA